VRATAKKNSTCYQNSGNLLFGRSNSITALNPEAAAKAEFIELANDPFPNPVLPAQPQLAGGTVRQAVDDIRASAAGRQMQMGERPSLIN
jgi:hypothetical protein